MLIPRNILFWILFIPYTVLYSIVYFPLSLIFFKRRHDFGVWWVVGYDWLLKNIIGLNYRVAGRQNANLEKPSIIACKHQSGHETLVLQRIFPWQVYVMKKSLIWLPIVGQGFLLMSAIPIDRSKGRQASDLLVTEGAKRRDRGLHITIFPEGTRVPPSVVKGYKKGAARMATRLGMDIAPVGVNSGEFWPKKALLMKPGVITYVVGHPIPHDMGDEKELTALLESTIEIFQDAITLKDDIDMAALETLIEEEKGTREARMAEIKRRFAEEGGTSLEAKPEAEPAPNRADAPTTEA